VDPELDIRKPFELPDQALVFDAIGGGIRLEDKDHGMAFFSKIHGIGQFYAGRAPLSRMVCCGARWARRNTAPGAVSEFVASTV
jgi:hypothetical protein